MYSSRRLVLQAAFAALPGLGSPLARAEAWPAKPIRIVVPFPAGGGTDILAREVSGAIAGAVRWSFVIDNKPGSGGNLGIDAVAKSAPDGYTLVIGQTANLAINPTLYARLPYDPLKDLTPIGLIGSSPLLIVTGATSPYKTLADLVAAAKARPGELNYASSGNGTVAHLAMELFQREAGIRLTHIPYKGASQGLTDVISGQVHVYASSVPTLLPQVKGGKLRALAVTSARRAADLSQTPTVAESGYPGFNALTWFGLLGPARLPAAVVTAVNAELGKALALPALRKKLEEQGVEITPGTPAEFGKLIAADMARWGRIVKETGSKAD
ncbi:MAG TPA: tripartite tricarboxylate transporter substrate binding protein [Burkholderiaceae bacterium]|jgi:tripartite-type tricarboxylate transporter receptor subunit TctC|nr:tripartite tricarboxylate transporter substrate binding protein [Burkholderiaceae bacterium]